MQTRNKVRTYRFLSSALSHDAHFSDGFRAVIATMNLEAGLLSQKRADIRKALQMYRHGIACLDENSNWTSQYSLSIKLFGAAAEASCHLNELDSVKSYSDAVEIHARSIDDKLPCACITTD